MPSGQLEHALSDPLRSFLDKVLNQNIQIEQIEDVKEAANWHESKKMRSKFLSNVSNSIVEKIMEEISVPYANILADQIRINIFDKQSNVKFNLSLELDPIKPYIEFVKVINGVSKSILKTIFQIDSNFSLTDIQVTKNGGQKVNLGQLSIHFELSLVKVGVLGYPYEIPRKLGEQEFTIDLSSYEIKI